MLLLHGDPLSCTLGRSCGYSTHPLIQCTHANILLHFITRANEYHPCASCVAEWARLLTPYIGTFKYCAVSLSLLIFQRSFFSTFACLACYYDCCSLASCCFLLVFCFFFSLFRRRCARCYCSCLSSLT